MKKAAYAPWLLGASLIGLGAAALTYGPPVPNRPAASVLAAGPRVSVASRWRTRTDSLKRGETVVQVLQRAGIEHDDAMAALRAARVLDPRKVPAGLEIVTRANADSAPSEIVFQLAIDRLVRLNRTGEGEWAQKEEKMQWNTDTVAVAGVVKSTLTGAIAAGAVAFPEKVRTELAYALADILEYRIDLSRDLQPGDSVHVLLERERTASGLVRPGQILAARLHVDGKPIETVHFEGRGTREAYFDGEGKSMRAAFLRAPLAFRRISSVFGLRKHPILGTFRSHKGTDYAAAAGTPVRALGNGTIIYAGWKSGFGNTVEIRHPNGMVTRYGHLRAFGAGIRRGTSVAISNTIGFVGMTGLATAPHLHFEVLINGVQRDSRVALKNIAGEPMAVADRGSFAAQKSKLFANLDAQLRRAPASGMSLISPATGTATDAVPQ
ncbi:MAG: peptidoglycan DD-metalloendopeptidase family protein [Gemmatimonas sp.]